MVGCLPKKYREHFTNRLQRRTVDLYGKEYLSGDVDERREDTIIRNLLMKVGKQNGGGEQAASSVLVVRKESYVAQVVDTHCTELPLVLLLPPDMMKLTKKQIEDITNIITRELGSDESRTASGVGEDGGGDGGECGTISCDLQIEFKVDSR